MALPPGCRLRLKIHFPLECLTLHICCGSQNSTNTVVHQHNKGPCTTKVQRLKKASIEKKLVVLVAALWLPPWCSLLALLAQHVALCTPLSWSIEVGRIGRGGAHVAPWPVAALLLSLPLPSCLLLSSKGANHMLVMDNTCAIAKLLTNACVKAKVVLKSKLRQARKLEEE